MTLEPVSPCPFCGAAHLTICQTEYQDRAAYAVTCRTRDCHGAIFALGFGLFESQAEAVHAWNQRARPK